MCWGDDRTRSLHGGTWWSCVGLHCGQWTLRHQAAWTFSGFWSQGFACLRPSGKKGQGLSAWQPGLFCCSGRDLADL